MSAGQAREKLASGLRLHIRLTPKSARDALEGMEARGDGKHVLKARVRAVQEDGKANKALLRLVADAMGVPASAVTLEAGATARIKTLMVNGDAAVLEARLLKLVG